jgi:hypothetical protein
LICVTNVRDMGNDPERLAGIRAAFDDGEVIGPRSVAARYAHSADALLEMIAKLHAAGVPLVAVFKGDRWFDPALLYEAVGIRPFTR